MLQIEHHFHPEVLKLLRELIALAKGIKSQGVRAMHSLQELKEAVAKESTVDASITTLVKSIKAALDAELANQAAGLSTDQQAIVDQIFDQVVNDTTAVSAAVVANTPSAPPAPVSPVDPTATIAGGSGTDTTVSGSGSDATNKTPA